MVATAAWYAAKLLTLATTKNYNNNNIKLQQTYCKNQNNKQIYKNNNNILCTANSYKYVIKTLLQLQQQSLRLPLVAQHCCCTHFCILRARTYTHACKRIYFALSFLMPHTLCAQYIRRKLHASYLSQLQPPNASAQPSTESTSWPLMSVAPARSVRSRPATG